MRKTSNNKNTKALLLSLLLLPAVAVRGQTCDSIAQLVFWPYSSEVRNLMQMRDGSILANCQLFDLQGGDHNGSVDYGNAFVKISRHGGMVLDTVFFPDPDMNFFLMEPEPSGKGYLFGKVLRDLHQGCSGFQLRRFNDDFVFTGETTVPLVDALMKPLADSYLHDGGNVIVACPVESSNELHVARIGLDGTLKDASVIENYKDAVSSLYGKYKMFKYSESPTEYCVWGLHFVQQGGYATDPRVKGFVLDSLLNLKEVISPVPRNWHGMLLTPHSGAADLIALDDSTLIASVDMSGGVGVVKVRKEDMEVVDVRPFWEGEETEGAAGASEAIGVSKTPDGGFYFAYFTFRGAIAANAMGRVSVVKMDADLNVLWQRFCLEPVGYNRMFGLVRALDDGVAVGGVNLSPWYGLPQGLFFLVVSDDYDGVEEQGVAVRPYTFWPNPVRDELHLRYSPDVKPAQAELFDLQGRLVLRQRNGLETLNLQRLAPGTYTLRVTLEDGKTFSDKVVKE